MLAEINEQMPRTHGNTVVPLERVTAFVHSDRPLHAVPPGEPGEVEARIGELIADLVEDGATLQMGIGAIPDAVLARLGNKHELGVHTEMFSDGLIPLMRERRGHQQPQAGAPRAHGDQLRQRLAASCSTSCTTTCWSSSIPAIAPTTRR